MNYKRILVFGAHPDDEMTMAAAMKKLSDLGVEVHVCISTDGCEGYPRPEWKDSIVEMRKKEQDEADQVMGVAKRHHIDSPDMGLVNDKGTFLKFPYWEKIGCFSGAVPAFMPLTPRRE